jgi:outer membrane protein TolC
MPTVPDDLERLTLRATTQRPELASLGAEVQALHEQGEGLLARNRPQFGVQGGYTYQENRYRTPDGIASVGVGINWNMWDGGKSRFKANALLQQAESLRSIRADLESRIRLEVRQSWLSIQEAQRRIEVTQEAVQHADENLRVNRKRYEYGTGTNTEVLDAVILRTETDRNHYNASYDAVLAVLRLRRAVGDL